MHPQRRHLAQVFERPRADHAMQKGRPVDLAVAVDAARYLIESAKRPVALVSLPPRVSTAIVYGKFLVTGTVAGVIDTRLAGAAHLAVVRFVGEEEGLFDEFDAPQHWYFVAASRHDAEH